MKNGFLILGIVLIMVGIGVVICGYNQMQPTELEKATNIVTKWGETLSGMKMPSLPKRNIAVPILTMILGGISFIAGLIMISKSGKEKAKVSPPQKQNYHSYCPNCGAQISDRDKFCPNCGKIIGGNDD